MVAQSKDIIFHNYSQSPVAEKVRVGFGIKQLKWYSVEIPRLPPKPMLTKLTGGYRRTPVMQIGADIYCDSLCILNELEKRFPTPSFYPKSDPGLMWCLSRWTDGALFDLSVKIVLGSAANELPEEFAQDRGRLYMGADWANGLKEANATLSHLASQLRGPLHRINHQLSDGRQFILGHEPAAIDAQLYHLIWFVRGRWSNGANFMSEFTFIEEWAKRISLLGHGHMHSFSAEEAIQIAKNSQSTCAPSIDPKDPQGFEKGMRIQVTPDVDGGEQPVQGMIQYADHDTVSLMRSDPDLGEVCVHFPRFGYRVEIL